MPVQYREQVATFEEFGSPCVCGAENFERVVVERVLSRPVVTDLIACVECRCVYYAPLPRPAPTPPAGPPMPSGVVSATVAPYPKEAALPGAARAHCQVPMMIDTGARFSLVTDTVLAQLGVV